MLPLNISRTAKLRAEEERRGKQTISTNHCHRQQENSLPAQSDVINKQRFIFLPWKREGTG